MKLRKLIIPAAALSGTYLLSVMPSMRRHSDTEKLKGYLYAHRGLHDNNSDAPENTLAAFSKAVEAGYGIELDVHLSQDGVPVVLHDFLLARMVRDENGDPPKGKISDYLYSELQKFHILNTSEKIPAFADVLKLVSGKVPLIVEYKAEDKNIDVCVKGNELLKAYDGLYCIESFNPYCVDWYRRNRPDIVRGQLSEAFTKSEEYRNRPFYFMLENLMLNWITKPDFIAYNIRDTENLSRRICRGLYRNTAVGWTVRDQEQYENAKKNFDIVIFDSFIPEDSRI